MVYKKRASELPLGISDKFKNDRKHYILKEWNLLTIAPPPKMIFYTYTTK